LRFNPKASSKTKVFFHGLALRGSQIGEAVGPVNEQGQAVGVEKIGDPPSSANEHGCGGVSSNVDENTFLGLVCRYFAGA